MDLLEAVDELQRRFVRTRTRGALAGQVAFRQKRWRRCLHFNTWPLGSPLGGLARRWDGGNVVTVGGHFEVNVPPRSPVLRAGRCL